MNGKWFVIKNKDRLGPYSAEELRAGMRDGRYLPTDLICQEGSAVQQILVDVDEIFSSSPAIFREAQATDDDAPRAKPTGSPTRVAAPPLPVTNPTRDLKRDSKPKAAPPAREKVSPNLPADLKAVARAPSAPKPMPAPEPDPTPQVSDTDATVLTGPAQNAPAAEEKRPAGNGKLFYVEEPPTSSGPSRILGPLRARELVAMFKGGFFRKQANVRRGSSDTVIPVAQFVARNDARKANAYVENDRGRKQARKPQTFSEKLSAFTRRMLLGKARDPRARRPGSSSGQQQQVVPLLSLFALTVGIVAALVAVSMMAPKGSLVDDIRERWFGNGYVQFRDLPKGSRPAPLGPGAVSGGDAVFGPLLRTARNQPAKTPAPASGTQISFGDDGSSQVGSIGPQKIAPQPIEPMKIEVAPRAKKPQATPMTSAQPRETKTPPKAKNKATSMPKSTATPKPTRTPKSTPRPTPRPTVAQAVATPRPAPVAQPIPKPAPIARNAAPASNLAAKVGQVVTLPGARYNPAELDACALKCRLGLTDRSGGRVTAVFFKGAFYPKLRASGGTATVKGSLKKEGADLVLYLQN